MPKLVAAVRFYDDVGIEYGKPFAKFDLEDLKSGDLSLSFTV